MQFSCSRNVILKEITIANEIISSRNTLSALSCVLLEAQEDTLKIKATDLKVSFETQIPISLETPGFALVLCGKFLGILRNFPEGDVFIAVEEGKLRITSGENIKFQLFSISPESFPETPDSQDFKYFSLPQKVFGYMIGHTIFAVSDDETRYFMNGVYMEPDEDKIVMVSTDGRRLSHVFAPPDDALPDFSGIIIPPKILGLFAKLSSGEGTVELAVVDRVLFIRFDKHKLTSTLVDGQFPDYKRVIPEKQEFEFKVNRIEFNDALRRVSLFSDQKTKRVMLSLFQGNVVLKSDEKEIGEAEERINCIYDGEEIAFAINYSYLVDPLKVIEKQNITVKFTDSNKAIMIVSPEDPTFFHIVMPMQME